MLIILSLAQVCRDEQNLDCWFELEEQVMLAVGSCSCSQMTTGSLSIGLRLIQAGCAPLCGLSVGRVHLLALR